MASLFFLSVVSVYHLICTPIHFSELNHKVNAANLECKNLGHAYIRNLGHLYELQLIPDDSGHFTKSDLSLWWSDLHTIKSVSFYTAPQKK